MTTDRLAPGAADFAQLFLSEPVVAAWNQPLVLRSESPAETMAGGRVLVPAATKLRQVSDLARQCLEQLRSPDPVTRAAAAVYFAETGCNGPQDLTRTAGIEEPGPVFQQLLERGTILELIHSSHRRTYLHAQLLDEYVSRILAYLEHLHQQHPLKSVFDRASLAQQFAYLGGAPLFDAAVQRMERRGQLRITSQGIGLASRGPQLSKGEQELLQRLVETYRAAGFQPPTVQEFQRTATRHQKSVPALVALAVGDGDLMAVSSEFYLHREVELELRQKLTAAMTDGRSMTLSEIRELLQTTRKYAVPICEYLDRIGFTEREGDLRRLSRSAAPIHNTHETPDPE